MGPLEPLLDQFGPAVLLVLALGGIGGLLVADRFLRWPHWVIVGVTLPWFLRVIDQTASTMVGTDGFGAIPLLGPLATLTALLVAAFGVARRSRDVSPPTVFLPAAGLYLMILVLDWFIIRAIADEDVVNLAVITAIWFSPRLDVTVVTRTAQALLGLILVASLLTWLAGGPGASSSYDAGLLPVGFRVSGVMQHANSLGPMAVLWLVLDRLRPLRMPWRVPMNVLAVVILLVSQSKTSWAVMAFSLLALLVAGENARRQIALLTTVAVGVVTLMMLSAFEVTQVTGPDGAVEEVTSLTGRTDVWAAGLEELDSDNWLYGAGGDVFERYAERTGREWAGQAHNQFVETTAGYGALGLSVLLVYCAALLRIGIALAGHSRNVSLALVGGLLLRSFTETPLDQLHIDHLITLMVVLTLQREYIKGKRWKPKQRSVRPLAVRGEVGVDDGGGPEDVPRTLTPSP